MSNDQLYVLISLQTLPKVAIAKYLGCICCHARPMVMDSIAIHMENRLSKQAP